VRSLTPTMGLPAPRDRSLPSPLARAATSPIPLAAGAGGGGLAFLAGGIVPALLVAVLVWVLVAGGLAVATTARRIAGPGTERIDPFAVGEPWRRFVKDAVTARNRFDEAAARTPPGPLHDRLREVGSRIAEGVDEVWRIAQHGHALGRARNDLGPGQLRRRLESAERAVAEGDASHEATASAIRSQLSSVERIETTIADAERRLRILDARLAESVARGIELSVQTAGTAALDAIDDDVDGVVGELEALRQALEETGGGSGSRP
jgi:hypothetical protein